jgi:hypothetical protein
MDLYQSSLLTVFAAIPVLYSSIAGSPLESLLESLLESRFESLVESLLERASHRGEYSFPWEAFSRWKTLSLWKLRIIEGSKSVEALAT